MRRLGGTPPFLGPDGRVRPHSVAEVAYLRLGGVDQWVLIRGEGLANPPLILLHGGPGLSETTSFRRCLSPLERGFTLVYWDQRGAGRSYHRSIPRSSMTLERLLDDLDELVDAVRRRVGADQVAVLGHSWGSVLGALYAGRHPEKVSVYVGSGQVGDWQAGERASYELVVAEARRRGNRRAIRALEAIGRPPHTPDQVWTQRLWLNRFEDRLNLQTLWRLVRDFLGTPERSILDLPDRMRGFRFSVVSLWPEVSSLNLLEAVPSLGMPAFFFLGRHDRWVPPEIGAAYVDAVEAPSKRLVWFERSGHEPFVDEPEKFNASILGLVRPVVSTLPP